MSVGFRNWKNAVERDKGFHKHANSKERLSCYAMWKEREKRASTGKEISTLVNADQLRKNRPVWRLPLQVTPVSASLYAVFPSPQLITACPPCCPER
ncbi:hypothetical protein KUCAC02_019397 [Chaenocephalus aceratus]|uniref:Uncharacterized protein n=1 Tax=Chaenocephalus aceratus TaxID=36190 RepID=A0ACB9VPP3_CHAAC|nr:hypothetical protein KUCAC02_019397 [Chaenocephalus aceratus]